VGDKSAKKGVGQMSDTILALLALGVCPLFRVFPWQKASWLRDTKAELLSAEKGPSDGNG
jgi:hypothetical protein